MPEKKTPLEVLFPIAFATIFIVGPAVCIAGMALGLIMEAIHACH
jgi:hypothetical protein